MTDSVRLREGLIQAVDQGLGIPGDSVRVAIYERLEISYHIKREEISEKLDRFHEALLDLLGVGAPVMERMIAKNLYCRLGLNFTKHEDWALVDYVDHANAKRSGE